MFLSPERKYRDNIPDRIRLRRLRLVLFGAHIERLRNLFYLVRQRCSLTNQGRVGGRGESSGPIGDMRAAQWRKCLVIDGNFSQSEPRLPVCLCNLSQTESSCMTSCDWRHKNPWIFVAASESAFIRFSFTILNQKYKPWFLIVILFYLLWNEKLCNIISTVFQMEFLPKQKRSDCFSGLCWWWCGCLILKGFNSNVIWKSLLDGEVTSVT